MKGMKKILFALCAPLSLIACTKNQSQKGEIKLENKTSVQATDINDYAKKSMFAVGKPNEAFSKYFSGDSYLEVLNNSSAFVANVTFEPGCRNNWHIHNVGSADVSRETASDAAVSASLARAPSRALSGGGQMLICVGGRG